MTIILSVFSRFRDLLITQRPQNFNGYVLKQTDAGISLTNGAATGNDRDPVMVFSPSRKLDLLDASFGYLALSAPMDHISKAQKQDYAKSMLTWIVAATSKIGITAHGDGEGNLEMRGDYMAADCIAKWFHENGLTAKGLLSNIGLNFCMAAKYKLTPAVIVNGQYTPAEGSAVAILAQALRQLWHQGGHRHREQRKRRRRETRNCGSGEPARPAHRESASVPWNQSPQQLFL